MSRSLDIQITAEGVESSEQYEQLKNEGCTLFGATSSAGRSPQKRG